MQDNFGRSFYYLRLSITDVCNFYCQYCLPNGYRKKNQDFLRIDEITRLAVAFIELGVKKIRLTGGEPTIRKDFIEIATRLSTIPGLDKLALTTNGYRLANQVDIYREAGIKYLTVSIDSLNADKFKKITQNNSLPQLLVGIDKALKLDFAAVKINVVLLKDINIDELDDMIAMTQYQNLSVRFIELMQTGDNIDYFKKHHISANIVSEKLIRNGWQKLSRSRDAGPAQEYIHPDYRGKVGIIAPYSQDFCTTCNRLRVTAKGELSLCLFGNIRYGMRHFLQSDDQIEALKGFILQKLPLKLKSHDLLEGKTGINHDFSSIGG